MNSDYLDRMLGLPAAEDNGLEELLYAVKTVPAHYSANLTVDLGNTTQMGNALFGWSQTSGVSNALCVASGTVVSQSIDMLHANTYTNVVITGQSTSGQLRVQVQTSDQDVSGQYTDPTSGLAQLPGVFQSGGIIWINSGGTGNGLFGPFTSGQAIASGFCVATALQRPSATPGANIGGGRYIRALVLSEATAQYAGPLTINFLGQFRTTGSGGGASWQPQTNSPTSIFGPVNV